MNKIKLEEIKNRALDEHIPIIMDETLEFLDDILKEKSIESILEIGTAVRIFFNMLFKIFKRKW